MRHGPAQTDGTLAAVEQRIADSQKRAAARVKKVQATERRARAAEEFAKHQAVAGYAILIAAELISAEIQEEVLASVAGEAVHLAKSNILDGRATLPRKQEGGTVIPFESLLDDEVAQIRAAREARSAAPPPPPPERTAPKPRTARTARVESEIANMAAHLVAQKRADEEVRSSWFAPFSFGSAASSHAAPPPRTPRARTKFDDVDFF